jgi:cell division protein FtsZ
MAISSPLLETSIEGAKGVLFNITGGSDLTLFEIQEAAAIIHESADAEANIIFGANIDESLGEEVRVTVIATGFDGPRLANTEPSSQRTRSPRQAHSFLDRNDLEIPPFILKHK